MYCIVNLMVVKAINVKAHSFIIIIIIIAAISFYISSKKIDVVDK